LRTMPSSGGTNREATVETLALHVGQAQLDALHLREERMATTRAVVDVACATLSLQTGEARSALEGLGQRRRQKMGVDVDHCRQKAASRCGGARGESNHIR